jgi:hypothetical protein
VEIETEQPGGGTPDWGFTFGKGDVFTRVKEGDLLGKLLPPTAGRLGKDVYGRDIKPPHPINMEIITDARIYAEEDEDGMLAFYAESEGGIYTAAEFKKVKNRMHRRISIGIYPVADEVESAPSSA